MECVGWGGVVGEVAGDVGARGEGCDRFLQTCMAPGQDHQHLYHGDVGQRNQGESKMVKPFSSCARVFTHWIVFIGSCGVGFAGGW